MMSWLIRLNPDIHGYAPTHKLFQRDGPRVTEMQWSRLAGTWAFAGDKYDPMPPTAENISRLQDESSVRGHSAAALRSLRHAISLNLHCWARVDLPRENLSISLEHSK